MPSQLSSFEAPPDVIRASYRRLCKLFHPDKHSDPELKEVIHTLLIHYFDFPDRPEHVSEDPAGL